jgi:hypothetical protein
VVAVVVAVVLLTGSPSRHVPSASTAAVSPTTQTSVQAATQSATQSATGTGYLASVSGSVIFLQWTPRGGRISGTAEVETLTGTPPNQSVSSDLIAVSGQINGSTITLSFNGSARVSGTLSSGSFTVNLRQIDGSVARVTFTAASASQFQQALSALEGTIGTAGKSAGNIQPIAPPPSVIDQPATPANGGTSRLQSDSATLTSHLVAYNQDLSNTEGDLATEAQEAQMVESEAQGGSDPDQICSDSDRVQSDADQVGADGGQVSYAAGGTEHDLSTVRSDVTQIAKDGLPDQSAVNLAVMAANAAISSALSAANAAIDQMNDYEIQAYNDAVAAAQAGNCSGPDVQFVLQPIS